MDAATLKLTKRSYFPTLIFQFDLPAPEALNDRLVELIYAEQARDEAGIVKSNIPALGGWHSKTDLHKSSDFAELTALIHGAAAQLGADQGYDPRYALKIGTMWSIINPPGCQNKAHVHPSSLMSGVYYVRAPEGSGDIEFIDPRTAHLMNPPRFDPASKRAKENWAKVRFQPVPGRMLFFPSWLYHAVDTNVAAGEGREGHRVIVSFNLNQSKIER